LRGRSRSAILDGASEIAIGEVWIWRHVMAGDRVREACEACFEAHMADSSGFARAVADELGVTLQGLADQIVETLRSGAGWTPLMDGRAAAQSAEAGQLVIAGLKGSEQTHPDAHGHVVVVVGEPLAHGAYPSAYWGRLGGVGARDQTINWAWTTDDRDHISYAAHDIHGIVAQPDYKPPRGYP
jgi:hypothetical protein